LQETSSNALWQFAYDYRNRLIMVEHKDNPLDEDWDSVAEYFYDAGNRRIKKDLHDGTDVVYLYDGWQCVEERDAGGEVLRRYVYGARYLDELVAKSESGSLTFYLQDSNYNVVALANSSGSVVERYWYEPYGTVTFTEGSGTERTSNILNPDLLFQGQRRDPETGLYYFRNRYYSPALGRFVQRDPAEYKDGMSLYQFEMLCVLINLDPMGFGPTLDEIKAGAAGGLESIGKTAASVVLFWGNVLGLTDKPMEEMYEMGPFGQTHNTVFEKPTKIAISTGAVAVSAAVAYYAAPAVALVAEKAAGVIAAGATGAAKGIAAGAVKAARFIPFLGPSIVANEKVQKGLEYVLSTEGKMKHIFDVKHALGGLVEKTGGETEALKAVLQKVHELNLPAGVFKEVLIKIGEECIHVSGRMMGEGWIKTGDIWLKK